MRRLLALGFLTASGGLLASACADNESSLFIRGHKVSEDESCTIDCGPDGLYSSEGLADAALGSAGYSVQLIVGNQLFPRGDGEVLRTETSRIELYQARVRVLDAGGNAISYGNGDAAEFSIPISGAIAPSTDGAGYGCTTVTLLDGGTLQSLRSAASQQGSVLVVANVVLLGRTLGGQELESGEWSYPIYVCAGCSCVDTIPQTCCANPAAAACSDVDDLEPSAADCELPRVDCRLLGKTCGEFAAGVQ